MSKFFTGIVSGIAAVAIGYLGLNLCWKNEKGRYSDGYADFRNGEKIFDRDVYEFTKNHTKILDRLDMHKTIDSAITAFTMLEGGIEMPKDKNWKF